MPDPWSYNASAKRQFRDDIRVRLDEVQAAIGRIERDIARAKIHPGSERFARLEELRAMLDNAEQKFVLFLDPDEDDWKEIKKDLERRWQAMRRVISEITAA